MDRLISIADAHRDFFAVLRAVRRGRSFVVTAGGRAVAKIILIDKPDKTIAPARAALFARLRSQPALDVGDWTRSDLYP